MARPLRSQSNSEAFIADGTTVRGRISGDGALSVFGTVEGDIHLGGPLTVGKGGVLRSSVTATEIRVDGEIEGELNAPEGSVSVGHEAKLRGNVHAARFSLEHGGSFEGQLDHDFDLPSQLEPASHATRR